jgi:hypothetical protein
MLAAVALTLAGSTAAGEGKHEERRLHGRYAFTTHRSCVFTTAGFNDDLSLKSTAPAGVPFQVFRIDANDEGVTDFDGRGHSHVRGHSSSLNLNVGPRGTPLADSDFQCTGTYSVEGSTVRNVRSCTFRFTSGPSKDLEGTVTGVLVQGRIIDGGRIILSDTLHPTVETQSHSTRDGQITYYRLCERSGATIRIEEDGHDD